MHLLEPSRFIRDEGLARTIGFLWKVARTPAARRRILHMRSVEAASELLTGGVPGPPYHPK